MLNVVFDSESITLHYGAAVSTFLTAPLVALLLVSLTISMIDNLSHVRQTYGDMDWLTLIKSLLILLTKLAWKVLLWWCLFALFGVKLAPQAEANMSIPPFLVSVFVIMTLGADLWRRVDEIISKPDNDEDDEGEEIDTPIDNRI